MKRRCQTPLTNNRHANHESKFEGKYADLKELVYDIITGKDTFTKKTQEITKYIGQEFDDAGEFCTGMVDLALCPLDEQMPPTNLSQVVEFELWKNQNSLRVYAVIIGQCSQALCNQMEANEEWDHINNESNIIDLLQLIQNCMIQWEMRQKPIHTLMDAKV